MTFNKYHILQVISALSLSCVTFTTFDKFSIVGYVAIVIYTLIMIFVFYEKKISVTTFYPIILSILVMTVMSLVNVNDMHSIKYPIIIVIMTFIYFYYSKIESINEEIKILSVVFLLFIVILSYVDSYIYPLFSNLNQKAMVIFSSLVFIYLNSSIRKPIKLLAMSTIFLLLLTTDSRTFIFSFIVITILCFFSKSKYRSISIGMILLVFIINIVYIWLYTSQYNELLNALSYQYTGKLLFSGRVEIWLEVIDSIEHDFLFGLGTGVLPEEVTGKQLSSHNSYLQMIFQNGILFFISFLIFTLSSGLMRKPYSKYELRSKISALVLLFCASFEVFLFQSSIFMSIVFFIILGLSSNKSWGRK